MFQGGEGPQMDMTSTGLGLSQVGPYPLVLWPFACPQTWMKARFCKSKSFAEQGRRKLEKRSRTRQNLCQTHDIYGTEAGLILTAQSSLKRAKEAFLHPVAIKVASVRSSAFLSVLLLTR